MSYKFPLIFIVAACSMLTSAQSDEIPPIQNQVLVNCQIVNNSYRRDSNTETGFREYTYAGPDGLIFHASTDNAKTKGASNRFSFVYSGQQTGPYNKWRILTSIQGIGGSGKNHRCLAFDGGNRARIDACNAENGIYSKIWQDRDFFFLDYDAYLTNDQNGKEVFVNLVNRNEATLSGIRYLSASGDFAINLLISGKGWESENWPMYQKNNEWLVVGCVNKWGVRVDPGQYSVRN